MAANFDRAQIIKTWEVFRQPGEVLEMRIPKAGRYKTISGYFDNSQVFADSVIGLADEGFAGIYFTINPVKPDLLARAANRYVKYAETTTSDADIIALHWLPVDLDAKRPAGISATDAEHEAATTKAREIRRWLIEEQSWPAGAFVLADSGNGCHLNIKIDMSNLPENVAIVKDCLEALDFLFSDDVIQVDTTSQNPARIWKLYGTMARKGDSTAERPHRLTRLIEVPENMGTVSRGQLTALAAMLPRPEEQPKTNGKGFDPAAYCQAHGLQVHHTKAYKGGTLAVLEECIFNPDHKLTACIIGWPRGARTYRCRHHSCLNKHWKDAKAIIEPESSTLKTSEQPTQKQDGAVRNLIKGIDLEELTEGGNASRLERLHGDDMRYNHTHKKWYLWDGGRWKVDGNGGAMRLADDVVGALYLAAAHADGKDAREKLTLHAWVTDSRKGLNNMLALAANRRQFAITADKLDSDAWLMGADDLTFDLRTCTKREPRREDLITKTIGPKYDKTAQCTTWLNFLARIFPDEELRKYIKRATGYCLTGSMVEQVFFFCYGLGANGKSVFLAILRALLGDYAKQADFSTFLVQRNEKVRNDLAALAGARVITATEAEEGGRLSMQVIKSWTGADPITARYLFAEYFTFQPTGKIWLAANNKPAIERNHAAWRRVRLIPFNVTIPEAEQDKNLESKLLLELPGILNWALEGLEDYLQNGLDTPKAVQDATTAYRQENDSLEQFASECCELGKLKVCKNSDLFGQYLNFCGMSGLKALSQKTFSLELSARDGVKSTRSKHGMTWTGIALKSEWCRVDDNPTSQAGAAKDVGLRQNAQPSSNSPIRGDFAHLTNDPTPHSDSTLHQPYTTSKTRDKAGFEQFKQNMAKRKCCLCGRTFPHDLTPYYNNGVSGYICTTCHMQGPPSEPVKADAQVKLSEVST